MKIIYLIGNDDDDFKIFKCTKSPTRIKKACPTTNRTQFQDNIVKKCCLWDSDIKECIKRTNHIQDTANWPPKKNL